VGWYVYFILFTGQIIERSTNKGRNLRVFEKMPNWEKLLEQICGNSK